MLGIRESISERQSTDFALVLNIAVGVVPNSD